MLRRAQALVALIQELPDCLSFRADLLAESSRVYKLDPTAASSSLDRIEQTIAVSILENDAMSVEDLTVLGNQCMESQIIQQFLRPQILFLIDHLEFDRNLRNTEILIKTGCLSDDIDLLGRRLRKYNRLQQTLSTLDKHHEELLRTGSSIEQLLDSEKSISLTRKHLKFVSDLV
jgi:hypothetical protein